MKSGQFTGRLWYHDIRGVCLSSLKIGFSGFFCADSERLHPPIRVQRDEAFSNTIYLVVLHINYGISSYVLTVNTFLVSVNLHAVSKCSSENALLNCSETVAHYLGISRENRDNYSALIALSGPLKTPSTAIFHLFNMTGHIRSSVRHAVSCNQ